MKNTYFRKVADVLDQAMWMPNWGLCPDVDLPRNKAILEVALRLSEQAFALLEEKADSFSWFIPVGLAGVYPFPITYDTKKERWAAVLYLSPELDSLDFDIAVASIAHELAHVSLGHRLLAGPELEEQEKAAWQLVDTWGFEEEARKHEQYYASR